MAKPVALLTVTDIPLDEDDQTPLDVLDLPQLYQKPSAKAILSILADLRSAPPSWESTPRVHTPRSPRSGSSTPFRHKRKIKSEGVPRYLTDIISSSLAWIDDEEEKEQIWGTASKRLSERSGRSAMGDLTRTFALPLQQSSSLDETAANLDNISTVDALASGVDNIVEVTLHEPALTADNIGFKTWASSYLLAQNLCHLRSFFPKLEQELSILELGAGTGLVGLAAAAVLQAHVILTDLQDIVPNLQKNLHANSATIASYGGSGEATVLDWSIPSALTLHSGRRPGPRSFHLILAADPIYSHEHPALFVKAVETHLSTSLDARLVVELPLRDSFAGERQDLRDRLSGMGLKILAQGQHVGFDDWTVKQEEEELVEVTCWWAVWGWT